MQPANTPVESREEAAQLAISLFESNLHIFEPAGVSLNALCNLFETSFDDRVGSDTTYLCAQSELPPETTTQPTSNPLPNPPPIVTPNGQPRNGGTRPDITGLLRCSSATLLGFRCSRIIMQPYTVCEIHLRYFWRHGCLPPGGCVTPDSFHLDHVGGLPGTHTSTLCTCQLVRHICADCSGNLL